jgi:hypothetical protein
MAKLDFNINDEMVNTIRVYQQLKDKRVKEHNIKSARNDEYINRLTTNAFKMLSAEIPKESLNKGGSIDYTQWRWIWDYAMNRNKRVLTRERHNKTQLVYHKMETPKTIQGKDSSPEIDHHAVTNKSLPIYEVTTMEKSLERATEKRVEGFDWEHHLGIEEKVKASLELYNHLEDKNKSEVLDNE